MDSEELYDYPKKTEIEYRNQSSDTYHYTIISEGHYLAQSILAKTQKKKNNCYRIPNDYKVVTYNSEGTSILLGTIVFGLQLKCVEQVRDSHHRSNVFRPIKTLSNSAKKSRIKYIGEGIRDFINNEITYLDHKDQLQIKSLTLLVGDQDWIVKYSDDEALKQQKRLAFIQAMDYNHISRNALHSIAKITTELDHEYIISNEKLNLDNLMQGIIPLYVTDININTSTLSIINNKEIHIDNEEVIHGIAESIGKAVLYSGIEDYQLLQKALAPLIQDLQDISNNRIVDEFNIK
ncbi:9375_t:CDS:2 [Cetraspora pellucida]|uniref:9375_t:CDS:1 n=1 Tax=Cetraspora pellucida TaxID=1433469 RepID=A0A9N9NE59_9GLOM|nr:9375_t:CDS:2 [Cetraspora pellucida]